MRHLQGSKAALVSMVEHYVDPLMSSRGYRRRKLVWNRRQEGVTHVLDIQMSKSSSAEELSFTINLGAFFELLWRTVWGRSVPRTIQENNCFPGIRIGQLIGEGPLHKDVWWDIDEHTDANMIGSEVRDLLLSKGLPFLDRCDSTLAALAVAEDPMLRRFPAERLYYAVLKHLAGEHEEAREILSKMLCNPKLKWWHEHARGVLDRLPALSS